MILTTMQVSVKTPLLSEMYHQKLQNQQKEKIQCKANYSQEESGDDNLGKAH